jgi:cell division transport system ATP-binding protein
MISFENVSVVYEEDIFALKNINCHVNNGDFLFVLGPSGAGKTTFLRLIYKEILPTAGKVIINKHDLLKLPKGRLPYFRRKLGIVFQDFKLLYDRTVNENIEFAMISVDQKISRIPKRRSEVLRLLKLNGKGHLYPHHLSGGEQQRVAIARAIANSPLILIADEPTGNLDDEISVDIINEFKQLNMIGMTVIIATHDDRLTNLVSNHHRLFLKDGELINAT